MTLITVEVSDLSFCSREAYRFSGLPEKSVADFLAPEVSVLSNRAIFLLSLASLLVMPNVAFRIFRQLRIQLGRSRLDLAEKSRRQIDDLIGHGINRLAK